MTDAVEKIEALPGHSPAELAYRVQTRGGTDYTAQAIIIATGARPQRLDVPGEREFRLRGLCYSAVSYAPLFVDRAVAVVGESGLALRATAELARIAKQVTLVAPTHGELGSPLGQRLRRMLNVFILEGYDVERVEGNLFARTLILSRGGRLRAQASGRAGFDPGD